MESAPKKAAPRRAASCGRTGEDNNAIIPFSGLSVLTCTPFDNFILGIQTWRFANGAGAWSHVRKNVDELLTGAGRRTISATQMKQEPNFPLHQVWSLARCL
jgi:hypothetical protein